MHLMMTTSNIQPEASTTVLSAMSLGSSTEDRRRLPEPSVLGAGSGADAVAASSTVADARDVQERPEPGRDRFFVVVLVRTRCLLGTAAAAASCSSPELSADDRLISWWRWVKR